jgi:hypothetical protein
LPGTRRATSLRRQTAGDEADERAYNTFTASMGGKVDTSNINVQSR